MNRIVIIGASSGIGAATARLFIERGWHVGIAARHREPLDAIAAEAPDRVTAAVIDITADDAGARLTALADATGGADVILNCVGIGYTNRDAAMDIDLATVRTNVEGFTRVVNTAYHYMAARGGGLVAAITSVAATGGLGIAAGYSASKSYEAVYLQALAQLSHLRREHVHITDIRPGFARTALLDPTRRYPMLMTPERVARGICRAILHRRCIVTIDWRWHLVTTLWRLIPDALWRRLPVKL